MLEFCIVELQQPGLNGALFLFSQKRKKREWKTDKAAIKIILLI